VIEMPRGEAAAAIATGVWTIPGERMKRKKGDVRERQDEPLAGRAIEILKERFEALGVQDFVFSGARRGRPVGGNAMLTVLRRMKVETTVHGFRSSFRDWAGNETSFPREVCEHALRAQGRRRNRAGLSPLRRAQEAARAHGAMGSLSGRRPGRHDRDRRGDAAMIRIADDRGCPQGLSWWGWQTDRKPTDEKPRG
jgi:hypothetical protein